MNTTVHPLLARRTSGVLLHITSLPGPHGCGDLGPAARHFVDWLAAAGQSLWQVLPLSPAGPGNSPYQSVSAFAGNPLMVDLDDLVRQGWLPWTPRQGFDHHRCDFERVAPWRMACLRKAWNGFAERASDVCRAALADFCTEHAHWLDDYALFMVLDERYGGPWSRWPQPLARRDPAALDEVRAQSAHALGFWRFVQWRFWVQWQGLRDYARSQGVQMVGDAPIFVAHHSADVWAHADQFLLDERMEPHVVAGVPPDYFSPTGQRWGNPLYNWDAMAHHGYRWWKDRLAHQFRQVDIVRLDHFRGFEAHWEIPASEPTAVAGQWQPGPGLHFFDAITEDLGPLPIIAEDLGLITPEVTALREACGFPGMRILQFAFGSGPKNPYLPHNLERHAVAYTGTHDNETTVGWWASAPAGERHAALDYLGPCIATEPHWTLVRAASQSVVNTVVVPFQDVLGLDTRHRMNTPGMATGCWEWRFEWSQVNHEPAERLAAMTRAHGRWPEH
ncbi:4-alpha-glucanotransferase [Hydrogenophaga pseudoflava]|uniref:4-alpha-glucanotransferase n=1 Tax=Hydrogenophaga pseudoflava TaxID=47421 RepID=UPI0027E3CDA8|nr:4-alpha-glucanotransferase [Hydrogenophaga pseudoflava]MDQ7743691.1 4-alpha-glucanotransferase [Hydrogenophaga pseudoflava]